MSDRDGQCSWGRCKRPRIEPEVVWQDRYHLPHYGRFCTGHTEQIQKAQAGRIAKRDAAQAAARARRIAHLMPGYEKALRDWQLLADCLEFADSEDEPALHEQYLQARAVLMGYKPKQPE